ncbi:MAG: twin-arginine translocase subunit TatC [Kiritimatiellaeota bacterium]|nr:twin-arginine translocase subunit TatC [Kiritimatiellota bacterium]
MAEKHIPDSTEELDPRVMDFWDHLEELRWVVFKSLLALMVGVGVGLMFTRSIYAVLLLPLQTIQDKTHIVLRYDGPLDAFLIKLKMAVLGGVVLAVPFVAYFIWTFVAPGLKARERKAVYIAGSAGLGFMLCGIAFGYYLLTLVLPILGKFADPGVQNLWRLKTYMDFAFRLLLGVGVAFELPVVLFVLVRLGLVKLEALQKGRPYAIVIALIVAAVLTPPDVFTQLMLGVPLVLLYELGVLAARWQEKVVRRRREVEAAGTEHDGDEDRRESANPPVDRNGDLEP